MVPPKGKSHGGGDRDRAISDPARRAAAKFPARHGPFGTIRALRRPPLTDPFDWQSLYPAGLRRAWTPPDQPLWGFLAARAERRPDAPAITFEGRTTGYGALWDAALAAGARFRGAGAVPGDRVLLVLPNCPEFVVAFHGALAAGLVVVAASPQLTPHEIAAVLGDAAPRVVVCEPAARDAIDAAVREADVAGPAVVPVEPGRGVGGPGRVAPVAASRDDLAVLQYTSGTTGGMKAACMSHGNLVANAVQNDLWFGWTGGDVVLGALPLCHTWGMGCVMNAALAVGARIVLLRHFRPDEALGALAVEDVTVAYGSATMFHRLLDAAGGDAPARFSTLRYVKAGAMLVGGDLAARWAAAVPSVPMVNGYGLTEAGPEVTNNPPHARRAGTVGVPLPGTEVRLCAPDDPERTVAPGEDGEVQVRGPQVTSGYWRRDDATRAAFAPGGWLRTGDLAAFDAAGYLVIRDRLKDLIKFRGWSVVPGEVEKALREHPAVAEACVVGVPDARDGEVPVAYLVLRPGAPPPGDAALRAHLDTRLAHHKHPRRTVCVAEIPKNHVGKPLRRLLRDRG